MKYQAWFSHNKGKSWHMYFRYKYSMQQECENAIRSLVNARTGINTSTGTPYLFRCQPVAGRTRTA